MSSASLITAIRGPVLLIALGGLFLADRFGTLEFWQTWPVLIIVFGVMKLLERVFGAREEEPVAPGGSFS